jgi:hypothetical protein
MFNWRNTLEIARCLLNIRHFDYRYFVTTKDLCIKTKCLNDLQVWKLEVGVGTWDAVEMKREAFDCGRPWVPSAVRNTQMLPRPSGHARWSLWGCISRGNFTFACGKHENVRVAFTRRATAVESHFLYRPLVSYLPSEFREISTLLRHLAVEWSCVILEKLIVAQILKNFTEFCGTRRFIVMMTRDQHWSWFWARWIYSTPSHPTSLASS